MAMFARGRVVASCAIARRTAPLAARGIVAVLVFPGRGVMASRPIRRRTAMPAFRLVLLRRHHSANQSKAERHPCNCLEIHNLPFFCIFAFDLATFSFHRGDISAFRNDFPIPYLQTLYPYIAVSIFAYNKSVNGRGNAVQLLQLKDTR